MDTDLGVLEDILETDSLQGPIMSKFNPTRNPIRRDWLRATTLAAFGTVVALAGAPAFADGGHAGTDGRGHMTRTQFGGGAGPGNVDPERVKSRMQERTRRMLSAVGASEAQITQIQGIWSAAMTDLAGIRKERQTGRQAISGLLSAPAIDRRALEEQRKQQLDDQ